MANWYDQLTQVQLDMYRGNQSAYTAEPYSGSGSIDHTFTSTMEGFVIANDGSDELTFNIPKLGVEIKVMPGEVFNGNFPPFKDVSVTASGSYRMYGKTSQVIIPEPPSEFTYSYLTDPSKFQESVTLTWKGTQFTVNNPFTLRGIMAWGTGLAEWTLYQVSDTVTKLETLIASGTFSGSPDASGYMAHELQEGVRLDAGGKYMLICRYDSGKSHFIYLDAQLSPSDYLNNEYVTITGERYNDATAPGVGSDTNNTLTIYDYKLVISID